MLLAHIMTGFNNVWTHMHQTLLFDNVWTHMHQTLLFDNVWTHGYYWSSAWLLLEQRMVIIGATTHDSFSSSAAKSFAL